MKTSSFSLPAAALAMLLAVSCEKPMSEADRNAQIEREVQQRVEAERQADERERLEQQQADLDAREQALADKESAANKKSTAQARRSPTNARTTERTETTPSSAPRSYDTFYRKLEPYGSWRETADYGYVWQPQQAQRSRTWRPYTEGRWAYSDAGWTWVSEEPFGWATYHYGRWTRLRGVGWVWVPGDEWAPAWVSWRTGPQHVGWAPLPPQARFERGTGIHRWADSYYDIDIGEYVFIPNEEIGSAELERVVVPVERNVTIINQTTNVTNITYNNTTIVNEGPSYEELRARSRQPLERVRLQRRREIREDQDSRAELRDGVVAMVAPDFTAETTQRPRNVGEPIRDVAVERETNAASEPEVQKARAKMKSEVTPPPNAPPKRYQKPKIVESTPTPAATAAATASPAGTASPTVAATATATPVATASPTATVRATVTATPAATASPTATVRAVVTPTPAATASPTPAATMTPRATIAPTASPRVTVAATPIPSPIASPTLTPPSTPAAAATATPTAKGRPTTTPPPAATTPAEDELDSPAAGEEDTTADGTAARPGKRRGDRAQGRADRLRERNAVRDPNIPDTGTGTTRAPSRSVVAPSESGAEPQLTPRAVATPRSKPAAAPDAAATATPVATTPAPRSGVTASPTATAAATAASAATRTADAGDDAAATATASPSEKQQPRGKKGKRGRKAADDVDVPEKDDASTEASEEP